MVAEQIRPLDSGDDSAPEWISTAEAARRSGIRANTLAQWCLYGLVTARRVTREDCRLRPLTYRPHAYRVWWPSVVARVALLRAALEPQPAGAGAPRQPTPREIGYPILRAVCEALDVRRADLEGTGRRPEHTKARRVAAVCLERAGLGPTAISRLLKRDHSTICHHLQVFSSRASFEERWGVEEVQRILSRPAAVTASLREQARERTAAGAGQRGGRG